MALLGESLRRNVFRADVGQWCLGCVYRASPTTTASFEDTRALVSDSVRSTVFSVLVCQGADRGIFDRVFSLAARFVAYLAGLSGTSKLPAPIHTTDWDSDRRRVRVSVAT